jgi:hypothetical protein
MGCSSTRDHIRKYGSGVIVGVRNKRSKTRRKAVQATLSLGLEQGRLLTLIKRSTYTSHSFEHSIDRGKWVGLPFHVNDGNADTGMNVPKSSQR